MHPLSIVSRWKEKDLLEKWVKIMWQLILPDISRLEQTAFSQHSQIIFLIVSSQQGSETEFPFHFLIFSPFFFPWLWCNWSSSGRVHVPFLHRLLAVRLPLAAGLWGGEQVEEVSKAQWYFEHLIKLLQPTEEQFGKLSQALAISKHAVWKPTWK